MAMMPPSVMLLEGVGNSSLKLAIAHSILQINLQDLPERVLQAKNEGWPKEYPEVIAERRFDFFSSSPVPVCNDYYVRDLPFFFFFPFLTEKLQLKKIMLILNSACHYLWSTKRLKCFPVTSVPVA